MRCSQWVGLLDGACTLSRTKERRTRRARVGRAESAPLPRFARASRGRARSRPRPRSSSLLSPPLDLPPGPPTSPTSHLHYSAAPCAPPPPPPCTAPSPHRLGPPPSFDPDSAPRPTSPTTTRGAARTTSAPPGRVSTRTAAQQARPRTLTPPLVRGLLLPPSPPIQPASHRNELTLNGTQPAMSSRTNTLRPSSSASWLGSLATTGPDLRFSTFGAPGSGSGAAPRRKVGAALFEEDLSLGAGQGRNSAEEGLGELRGLERGSEQGWSVTVAEGPMARSRSRKVRRPSSTQEGSAASRANAQLVPCSPTRP